MPKLDTTMHLDMWRAGRRRRSRSERFKQAINILLGQRDLYGLEWGDPETSPPLGYVRDHFIRPYVLPSTTVVEIGPGGGRWTRYMLHAQQIYAVDYHEELLDELKTHFRAKNITLIKNGGDDFPGIPNSSVDFIFSFGTFVHLDTDIIDAYLRNMKRLLKRESIVVLQYSDKTKPLGKANSGFSENNPEKMRELVLAHGYAIREEDTKTLWHSSIIRFSLSQPES